MKEQKIGGVQFTSDVAANTDPYIIGVFGEESAGKTRLALTGPDAIGGVILENKSYKTIEKDGTELGKRVFKPVDPGALLIPSRKVEAMAEDVDKEKFYAAHVRKVEETVYGLLEHKDVRTVMVDKFTHYCHWKEFAINGMQPKFVRVKGELYQSKREVVQGIIDFVNSLAAYKKTVLLLCASMPDYNFLGTDGKPLRNTADCGSYKFLGSHCNLLVGLETNAHWNLEKFEKSGGVVEVGNAGYEKHGWKYALSIRRCQDRPELEGPDGYRVLRDEQISVPALVQLVNPNVNIDEYL